jgi:hypothetical protein
MDGVQLAGLDPLQHRLLAGAEAFCFVASCMVT